MKLLALTTCNDDQNYYRWIPFAIPFWRKLGFDFVVHFYADKLPDQLSEWSDYIVLERPPSRLKLSSVCQISRLYLPTLHSSYDQVIVTDVDLLPLSPTYFSMVKDFRSDKFVAMRKKEEEFFMGFNCASPAMWQKLTNVRPDRKGIEDTLRTIFSKHRIRRTKNLFGLKGVEVRWGLDQKLLKQYFEKMEEQEKMCISRLNEVYSLLSGFIVKPAYFSGDGTQVDDEWLSRNKEKVAFYTRDDSRSLTDFDREVSFLSEAYEID